MEIESLTGQDLQQGNEQLADAIRLSVKYWWSKLKAIADKPFKIRERIFSEALKNLPGSYKLWYNYLYEGIEDAKSFCVLSLRYKRINQQFERALVFMHKMPRIWILYLDFLAIQKKHTMIRRVFDRALKALPLTQHHKLWEIILEWIQDVPVPELAKHFFERYMKIKPDCVESYVEYLEKIEDYDELIRHLIEIINDDGFVSMSGKSDYEYCMQACQLISEHPEACGNVDGDMVIRHCLKKYTDEVGNLWVFLAEHYIKQGLFEKGRDIFEEALGSVVTARDFGVVYSSYLKFEEEILMLIMEEEIPEEEEIDNRENEMTQLSVMLDQLLDLSGKEDLNEVEEDQEIFSSEDLAIKRVENLIERRDIMLNSCILRQNPNLVEEWDKRLDLLRSDEQAYLRTFYEAINAINPFEAEGDVSLIWKRFAEFYEESGDLAMANKVYWKAARAEFRYAEHSCNIWLFWTEMLIRNGAYKDAINTIKYPLSLPPSDSYGKKFAYSHKMWSLYCDLTLNFGKHKEIKAVYMRMIELKVISPKSLLNYAYYLLKKNSYEEAFRVFERGLNIFKWPSLCAVWINYLVQLELRFKDKKVERLRDLYERVLLEAPDKYKRIFYIMYSEMEENFGLLNHSIEIIDRMTDHLQDDLKVEAFNLYITKVTEYLGVIRTKPIYEKALEYLKGEHFVDFGLRFATLEKKLGEVDRARQILNYISPFCDPEQDKVKFWEFWEEFELDFGNDDTYKDMMRVRRTIESKFSVLPPTVERVEELIKREDDEKMKMMEEASKLEENGKLIQSVRENFTKDDVMVEEGEEAEI